MKYKIIGLAVLLLLGFGLLKFEKPKPIVESQKVIGTIPAQFDDESLFLSPIKQLTEKPSDQKVTGITVPHHLLVPDLIAKAFNFASNATPDQILLISPDHFTLGDTDVSIADENFDTVFGSIQTDQQAVNTLTQLPFVQRQTFFYREHGVGAELPFIKYYFPNAKVIVIAFNYNTKQSELDALIDLLKQKVLDKNSFVVQSTDFSHYLTPENAEVHDEQTMKVLQTGNPLELFKLTEPDNIDSIASEYVQMRLQQEFYHSKLNIIAHKNSQDYSPERIDSTTSYIVQAWY